MGRTIVAAVVASIAAGAYAAPPVDLLRALSERERELSQAGRFNEAEGVLQQVRSLAVEHALPQLERGAVYHLARTAVWRGQPDLAIERLGEAIELGFKGWRHLAADEAFEPLRSDGTLQPMIRALREADHVTWSFEPHVRPVRHCYDPPTTPQLLELLHHGLGEAVADAADDLQLAAALTGWAQQAFAHDGSRAPASGHDDPLSLVTAGAAGERFRCVEFAVVTAGAARAMGLPARVVYITVADVEITPAAAGHAVAEIWLPDRQRWVLADGQFGVLPVIDGAPLSAVELRQAIWEGAPVSCLGQGADRCAEWQSWVYPYLYHVIVDEDQRLYDGQEPTRRVMLVPAGAPRPRRFQGAEAPYRGMEYTSDPHVLYPAGRG